MKISNDTKPRNDIPSNIANIIIFKGVISKGSALPSPSRLFKTILNTKKLNR